MGKKKKKKKLIQWQYCSLQLIKINGKKKRKGGSRLSSSLLWNITSMPKGSVICEQEGGSFSDCCNVLILASGK